jgi:multisubunit Na+/H+ antiporter MnhE subunit
VVRKPKILRSDEPPRQVPHLVILIVGQVLGGFIVAIAVSTLITSFFPELSNIWRLVLLLGITALFGFAGVWAQMLDIARREEARRKGITLINVPRRF